jgi:hypothetical protein
MMAIPGESLMSYFFPVLIVATVLPGIAPAPTSSAVREATLAELLSGSWVGTWTRKGQTDAGVTLRPGVFTLPKLPQVPLRLVLRDEGRGRFCGTLGQEALLGIWRYEHGVLTLCWRSTEAGYPERFSDEERQDLIQPRMR